MFDGRVTAAYELLHEIFRATSNGDVVPDCGSEPALTTAQQRVLVAVDGAESIHLAELSRRVRRGTPAVSEIVEQLVRQGLVDRQPDETDRRRAVLRITPAGTAQLDQVRQVTQRSLAALFSRMTDDECDLVLSGLEMLARATHRLGDLDPTPEPGGVE